MGKAKNKVRIWFDPEGDLLQVTLKEGKGFFRPPKDDTLIRVNEQGEMLGFMVLNVTKRETKRPIAITA